MTTKKAIRHGTFETNSSSSHAICIAKALTLNDTIQPDSEHGHIIIRGGEFGWEWDIYRDAHTKAMYCAQDNANDPKRLGMLQKVIEDFTHFPVTFDGLKDGYVDHQSQGTSAEAFESEDTLRRFLFNTTSKLCTGNDNSEPPTDTWYTPDPEPQRCKVRLKSD